MREYGFPFIKTTYSTTIIFQQANSTTNVFFQQLIQLLPFFQFLYKAHFSKMTSHMFVLRLRLETKFYTYIINVFYSILVTVSCTPVRHDVRRIITGFTPVHLIIQI